MSYDIAVLSGNHIGPEVMSEALKVLKAVASAENFTLNFCNALIGGAAIDATGAPLPDETLKLCRESEAVILGSVGGPAWDHLDPDIRPEIGGKALETAFNRPIHRPPDLWRERKANPRGG